MTPIDTSKVLELSSILYYSRDWHCREQNRTGLHPAVLAAMEATGAKDWHSVILEWPHRSTGNPLKLAYTQNEKKAEANLQTVTSVGKYLTKNFPSLADHVIRSLVDRFNAAGCEIHLTAEMILKAVQEGPVSCMQWETDCGDHPYSAYDPKYGWGMAVRISNGRIDGRALILDHDDNKVFVRTYQRAEGEGYSQRDTELEEWLVGQGYRHAGGWPEGAKLAKIDNGAGYAPLLPYIDGCNNFVDDCGSHLVIDGSGQWECDHTDGSATAANTRQCEDCGERMSDDGGTYIGRFSGNCVCESCAVAFTLVTGAHGEEYYVRNSDVVAVDGEYYHDDFLGDNNIVCLEDGNYAHLDNATCCEISNEWHLPEYCTYVEDLQAYVHSDRAWKCEESGNWYSEEEESTVDADGNTVHPDCIEEEDDSDCGDTAQSVIVA